MAAAMVERLNRNPPWRLPYLKYTGASTPAALLPKVQLIGDLIYSKAPPSREEVLPTITKLVQTGEVEQAKDLWFAVQNASGSLYDPAFDHLMRTGGSPFEWTQLSVLGANVKTEPVRDGKNGAVLSVTTDGAAAGILLRQLLALAPGEHILDYRGVIPTNARQAFGWQVRCLKAGTLLSTIGATSPPYRFLVPKDCQSQYIELRVTSNPGAAGSEVTFNQLIVR